MTYVPQDNKRTGRRFPRGRCSICPGMFPLRDDGTIRKHRGGARGTVCIGSGFLPASATDSAATVT